MLNSLVGTCTGISEVATFDEQIFVLAELGSCKQFYCQLLFQHVNISRIKQIKLIFQCGFFFIFDLAYRKKQKSSSNSQKKLNRKCHQQIKS